MKKKLVLLMLAVLAALSLVACGEISYDKIGGDWKVTEDNIRGLWKHDLHFFSHFFENFACNSIYIVLDYEMDFCERRELR